LRANAFGLHNVHGNVSEWCGDAGFAKALPHEGDGLRDDGVDGSGSRVFRGGSWAASASIARSEYRIACSPWFRSFDYGFRPSRSITP
jgi:formylglycine-generating enzyme required for sulfatase activity